MKPPQIYWEEVEIGNELPSIELLINARRLYLQISGSQDWYPVHHDVDFAQKAGHQGLFTTTGFVQAALVRMITNWIGDEGWLQKLHFEMRRQNRPGDTMVCRGNVTNKHTENNRYLVECDVWAENSRAGITTPGKAVVILPPRP